NLRERPQTHLNCASSGDDNDGCGITDFAADVYGHSFNLIDGGVYAHLVGPTGIKIWHFPRASIPGDITAKTPNPANWGKPVAFLVITKTSEMGKGAGNVFPGGMSACVEAVANPINFVFAKWKLNYVSVYES
ncbi:hypothetical protein B0H14DRAFT_2726409, partial [Mycena olivaceomarginata]